MDPIPPPPEPLDPRLEWNDDYLVGEADIDSQHRHLFQMAQDIHDLDNEADLRLAVFQLFRYVRVHFQDEEGFMKAADYPATDQHIAQHEAMIEKLSRLTDGSQEDFPSVERLRRFILDWIVIHVLEHDQGLFKWLRQRRQRAP